MKVGEVMVGRVEEERRSNGSVNIGGEFGMEKHG